MLKMFGRIRQLQNMLTVSQSYRAHPFVVTRELHHWFDLVPRSFNPLIAKNADYGLCPRLHRTNNLLSMEWDWLRNVSSDEMLQIREGGELTALRQLLDSELKRLYSSPVSESEKVAYDVDDSLFTAFSRHRISLQQLDATYKNNVAIDLAFICPAIFGALQPVLLPGYESLAILLPVAGAASLKDLVSKTVEHLRARRSLAATPVGVLWRAHEKGPSPNRV